MISTYKIICHYARLEKAMGRLLPLPFFENPISDCGIFKDNKPLDVVQLQMLAREMAESIGLQGLSFLVHVDSMEKNVAGYIEWPTGSVDDPVIVVSHKALCHYQTLVMILAHELSHQLLRTLYIKYEDERTNELMTDVTSVLLGFGKYILNGLKVCEHETDRFGQVITREWSPGYLSRLEFAYVYYLASQIGSIDKAHAFDDLVGDAVDSLVDVRQSDLFVELRLKGVRVKSSKKFKRLVHKIEDLEVLQAKTEQLQCIGFGHGQDRPSILKWSRESLIRARNMIAMYAREHGAALRQALAIALEQSFVAEISNYLKSEHDIFVRLEDYAEDLSKRLKNEMIIREWSKEIKGGKIEFQCPKCSANLRLPAGMARVSVHCPKCDYTFDYSTTPPHIDDCRFTQWIKCFEEIWRSLRRQGV